MPEFVRIDRQPDLGVATLRLDRPKLNALNLTLLREIADAAGELARDETVRAVVLYGGERAFSAGADIKEMATRDFPAAAAVAGEPQDAFTAVARLPKPVIAAITGVALGGGCELALAADFRFATADARLAQPEISLGIIPGFGGTQRLPRLVGPAVAKDLIYSGRFVPAEEARRIGLVDKVVDGDVYQAALDAAARYAQGAALALRAAKQSIDTGLETDIDSGLLLERHAFQSLFATQDAQGALRSFAEHGPGKAVFTGR